MYIIVYSIVAYCNDCQIFIKEAEAGNGKVIFNMLSFMKAVEKGQTENIKLLIEGEADLNTRKDMKSRALLISACRGDTECVRMLIETGADVNCIYPHQQSLKPQQNTPLLLAAHNGNPGCSKLLTHAGADVNMCNYMNETALILASKESHIECVRLLVESGADLNIQDRQGFTASLWAASKGNESILTYLIEEGADVNKAEESGCTVMTYVLEDRYLDCLKLLLRKGAHVNLRHKWSQYRNFLENYLYWKRHKLDRFTRMLLFAAGENIGERLSRWHIPDFIKCLQEAESVNLKASCRKAIRKHLLQMSNVNLFARVPELGLPILLQEYLLYDVPISDFRVLTMAV